MPGFRISRFLLASTALTCAAVGLPASSQAGPEGGSVTAGSAVITQSGPATAIHQSSDRAIIDWRSFNVDASESVRFYQPGTSSITVNRINDSQASQINGRVEANGQIMLLNQNGIVFGSGSRIDVAGMVASTGRINDAAFMSGASTLEVTPGDNHAASIINNGTITARDAGLVGLVGPHVENNGVIQARLGRVTLAGAEHVTLDLAGDQLISIDVTDQVNGTVKNTGTITADGGTITLTAARARNAVENSIINTGTLRANSVSTRNGRIILSAGGHRPNAPQRNDTQEAAIKQAGTIQAASGKVEILGDSIQLTETSVTDTSAIDNGNGGTINIGGSYQGAPDRVTATWVRADHGAVIDSNGHANGNGGTIILWADRLMTFRSEIEAEGGEQSGNGGFVEISGKNRLIYDGKVSTKALHGKTGTLLLDPTNIEINATNQNVTGTSPFEPDADDAVSILNAATLLSALGSTSVIVQTRATGSQAGDITVNAALSWASGNTLTLDAHNDIIINQAISGANLTLSAGNDVAINAALTGSGTLTIAPRDVAGTLGVAGGTGNLNLSTTDLGNITDGWQDIILGRSDQTGATNVNAYTWLDRLTMKSGTGVLTIDGIQTMGANNLTLMTDADIALNAALTGTGTLTIQGSTAATSIGLAGQAGTLNLTTVELGRITNGWGNIIIGRTDGSGLIDVGVTTWNDFLTFQSGTGVITISGTQTLTTNTLTFITDGDIALNGALTGSTSLTFAQASAGTTMGLNGAGTINLTTAELANITNGWTSLNFGRVDGSGTMTVGARTWNDHLFLQSGNGLIDITGIQTMATNNLTITTDGDIGIGGALTSTGTGTLTIKGQNAATTIGLGTGQTGMIQLTNAEVANLSNAWAGIIIGRVDGTGDINVGASAWADPLTLRALTGAINITGAQTMATNSLTINTDGNLNIGGALTSTGTGKLTIAGQSAATTMGLGTGQTGMLQLTNAEVTNLSNAWASILIGRVDGTGDINVGAASWADPLTLRTLSGAINITGAQSMAANSLTITTDGNLNIGGTLTSTGTGILTITGQSAATTMGLGTGQTGMLQLTNAEVTNLSNAWAGIVIGRVDGTGDINVGAATWLDPLTLRTLTGVINITGTQTMATNSLTITTNADLNVGGTLSSTGTGTLTITGQSAATTMGFGTGQAGTIQLTDAEVTNLTNNWASVILGRTDGTGAINIGAATWLDPLTLRSLSGVISIAGTQTMGTNNLTITTDANISIGGTLSSTGTGILTLTGQSAGTTIGIGTGQAGSIQLTDAEVTNLTNNWASVIIGLTTGTGAMNVGTSAWLDPLTLRTSSGLITIAGTQTMNANNLTISTDSNLTLSGGANLTGAGGILTITSTTAATTIGLGTGTGTLNLNDTELGQITNGWGGIVIGNAAGTGIMNVGTRAWNDILTLRSTTGVININGVQTMNAGNNLTIITDSNLNIAAAGGLTGTGDLFIRTNAIATTMALGAGQTGTLNLTDVELANITDGWANLIFGQTGGTGAINIGTMTWNDDLAIQSNTGAVTVNGIQTFNANDLTITSNGDPTFNALLSGTGALTLQAQAVATTVGVSGGAGTFNLSNNDLANIFNGWTQVNIGRNDGTGTMTIGSYAWQYDTTFRTGAGVITVSGAQTSTGNSLTYETDGNIVISANITGSGILTFRPSAAATIMNIATGTTNLNITAAELAFIQDGWAKQVYGRTGTTGAVNIGAKTWTDSVQFISGTGLMTAAAQTMNTATNLTFTTDSNLALSGTMVGTGGMLTIEGASITTGIGVGTGQTGALVLDATDISRLGTTWSTNGIRIGSTTATADINLGANAWTQPMTFISKGNVILNGAQTSNRTSGSSLVFASTGGNFVNNTGSATPITAGTGTARYLIYSLSAATDTYGTMTPPSSILAKNFYGYGPSSVVETGNQIIYSNNAPKVIFIQIDSRAKVYGDVVAGLSWSYLGGLEGADTLTSAITASNLSATGALTSDNVGVTRTITGSFTTALGYTVSFTDGLLSVIKAPVNIQAVAASRVYGDANPTFTLTYTGLRNGETSAVIDTQATASTTATLTSNVGTYNIVSSGAVDTNYAFNYGTTLLTVTKANLSLTADDKTRIYGDANPALTITYSGFKNGDTSALIDTAPTLATAAIGTTAVGTAAITLAGGLDNNYNLVLTNGTLTITKATLTATADNKSRDYGDANPGLTTTYTGFKNGEVFGVLDTQATAVTTATALTNVGSYVISTSGAIDNNYDFVYADGALTINKATLTATADNKSRDYGDANPALTTTYTGFKNGENSGVIDTQATAVTAATVLSNVGSYVISTSGAADTNYNFSYVDGALTINKATLTATADNKSREYGDSNPAFTTTYTGFKNGENSGVIDTQATAVTAATALTNVGSYAISTSGAIDNNYTFSYVNGALTITKATLTATADDKSREYGDANPALTTTYTGFKNGENSGVIDTQATAVTAATALTNVGSYVISTSGAADTNYNFSYVDGALTINKATLTATADNKFRDYGDANPSLTTTYTGFKNGENSGVIDTQATAVTAATVLSNVGSYVISTSGAADTNYNFSYVDGALTINKATLTATADNKSREYGDGNPALTTTYTGFKNGENSGVIDTQANAITAATALSNVGSYIIGTSGATDNNYNFSYVDGALTITKATLTATADDKSRDYGDTNPALTTTYTGFKNGENSGVIDTQATAVTAATVLSNVGSYVISTSGAADTNYNFSYVNGALTINKTTLTATADNKSREYGDANPALTTTYTGFKNGENSGVIDTQATASTAATALTNVGSYVIGTSGAVDDNYTFSYVNGALTITKATLTATADNKSRDYGDANPALTTTYTGFKNGENSGVIDTLATATTAATALTNVGSYVIGTSGATDTNYDFAYVDGTLTINKATLTATADNKTREYGDANPALTTTYTGFKNGENSGVIDTQATAVTAATVLNNVGSYVISTSGAADTNYNFSYVNGALTITKATLTATADDKSRDYGNANPALTISYSGFKNGQTSTALTTQATATTAANAVSDVGTYAITSGGGTATNYNIVNSNGTLTINKATLILTADNKTRAYGDANPALTISYSGFKNGQNASVLDTAPTIGTTAGLASNVGAYAISLTGGLDNNYDLVLNDAIMTVTKANLAVTADDKTKLYGDANPALTISYSGFKNGDGTGDLDALATVGTTATILTNAGTYSITTSGGSDDNYNYVYGSGILTIGKAALTITADNKTREYGDANPTFTLSYSGFKNGDDATDLSSGPSATSAGPTGNVGTHAITLSGGIDTNYAYTLQNGTLTITKANLIITADNKTRQYGLANPGMTATYSGFKNGETSSVLDLAPSLVTAAAIGSNVGNYVITASGGPDNNYSLTFVNGNFQITKAAVSVQVANQIRLFDTPNLPLAYTVVGLRNGDTEAVLPGLTVSTTATQSSPVGDYIIDAYGATAINYTISYVPATLRILDGLPVVEPEIPATVGYTLSNTQATGGGYTATYNAPAPYSFMTNAIPAGYEPESATGSSNGYITIYYYPDPFAAAGGEPLIYIDPLLYRDDIRKKLSLALD